MRYGIVRTWDDQPSVTVQRRLLEQAGAEMLFEPDPTNGAGRRHLLALLQSLRAGDEVLVCRLEALELTTGQLAVLLRRFYEAGVTLRIVGAARIETVAPAGPLPRALALLADHEARRPSDVAVRRRARTTATLLTLHQLRFARDLHRRGRSLREIGLIFRLSPAEMAEALRVRPD